MPALTHGRSAASARSGNPSRARTRRAAATMSSRLSSSVPSRSRPISFMSRERRREAPARNCHQQRRREAPARNCHQQRRREAPARNVISSAAAKRRRGIVISAGIAREVLDAAAAVGVLGHLALAAERTLVRGERAAVVRDHFVRDAAGNEQDVAGFDRDRVLVEVKRDHAVDRAADFGFVVRMAAALEPRRARSAGRRPCSRSRSSRPRRSPRSAAPCAAT